MKASEKAKEIVQKIFNEQHSDDKAILIMISTKQIALILVDELIEQFTNKCCEHQNRIYWGDVKKEIQKY